MTGIDAYIRDLDTRLHVGRHRRAAILDEVRDHLTESAGAAIRGGVTPVQAEADAVTAFGLPQDMARQFNAAAGARAMRRAPMVASLTGAVVVAVFLSVAVSQPRSDHPASVDTQVTFFAAVLGFQIALVAGVRAASRAAAAWRTSATSGDDRSLVRRSAIISMSALCAGTLALTANFALVTRHTAHTNSAAFAAGGVALILAAVTGLVMTVRLGINPDDIDSHSARRTPQALTLGESVIARVYPHPIVACTAATIAATTWAMNGSETAFPASVWWGGAEGITVIAAFILLGPLLGLRPAPTS